MPLTPKLLCNTLFVLGFLICLGFQTIAQTAELTGNVQDVDGIAVPFVNVFIKQLGKGTTTNDEGEFRIPNLNHGSYEVTISAVGFQSQVITATVPGPGLVIKLEVSTEQLAEVTIAGKSETQLAKEQSIKAEVINTKALASQPATMIELVNRSSGV